MCSVVLDFSALSRRISSDCNPESTSDNSSIGRSGTAGAGGCSHFVDTFEDFFTLHRSKSGLRSGPGRAMQHALPIQRGGAWGNRDEREQAVLSLSSP
jgi:hypothetical protein